MITQLLISAVMAISPFTPKTPVSDVPKQYAKLMKAEIYLRAMAYWVDEIEIVKWDNRQWGEIPADFDRK